jgi:hypothetical protein
VTALPGQPDLAAPDLPDWGLPLGLADHAAYAAYEDRGPGLVLPESLEVATDPAGRPEFRLALVRPADPRSPPAPYAQLELRLRAASPLNEAALAAAAAAPRGLAAARIARGTLQLQPAAALGEVAPELKAPLALDWNGLGLTRLSLRLAPEAGSILRDAVAGGTLLLGGVAELEVFGVAPLLPVTVRFAARPLLAALRPPGGGPLSRGVLEASLRRDPAALGISGSADLKALDTNLLVAALADRIRWRFGQPAPAPQPELGPALLLPPDDAALDGTIEWNLAEPVIAPRGLLLACDPLAAARALAAREGVGALVVETTVPSLPTGLHRVSVVANLPPARSGVALLGANLRFPGVPPARPQEIRASVRIEPPADGGDVDVRLAPNEPLAWRLAVFAVLPRPGGAERLEGPEIAGEGPRALVGPGLLPVRFVELEAAPALTALADLDGEIAGRRGAATWRVSFRLGAAAPRAALALPLDLAEPSLSVRAVPRDGGPAAALPERPARDLRLDLHLFPGYGAQQVAIECVFDTPVSLAAIELRGEDAPEAEAEAIALTPARPSVEWRWLSRSPFHSGLRWRWRAAEGAAPAPWSAPMPPGGRLQIATSMKGLPP